MDRPTSTGPLPDSRTRLQIDFVAEIGTEELPGFESFQPPSRHSTTRLAVSWFRHQSAPSCPGRELVSHSLRRQCFKSTANLDLREARNRGDRRRTVWLPSEGEPRTANGKNLTGIRKTVGQVEDWRAASVTSGTPFRCCAGRADPGARNASSREDSAAPPDDAKRLPCRDGREYRCRIERGADGWPNMTVRWPSN